MNFRKTVFIKIFILCTVFTADCTGRNSVSGASTDSGERGEVGRQLEYAAVIDAGSSGSRIRIYRIAGIGKDLIPEVTELGTEDKTLQMKIEPGISELNGRNENLSPEKLGEYLNPLFASGKSILSKEGLREDQFRNVPIYFGATAGVRRLSQERQTKLMNLVSSVLKDSGFLSKGALVVSGEFEGVYAWTCINSLKGTLGAKTKDTYGILEMGGASTQITFVPEKGPYQSPRRFRLGEREYPLYSYSYNALGINEARALLDHSECRNPKGNYEKCKAKIALDLNADRFCGTTTACGLQGVSQPAPGGKFIALGNFANLGTDLGLTYLSSVKLDEAGKQICRSSEEKIREMFPGLSKTPQKFLNGTCFHSALTSVMLSGNGKGYDGLGFTADSESIEPVRSVNNEAPSWTKGLVIMEKTGNHTWESE